MKIIATLLLLVSVLYSCDVNDTGSNIADGGIYEGNITLFSQASVDAFGDKNYTEITGDLIINRHHNEGIIENLESLSSLKRIGGSLEIKDINTPDLEGLHNITFVGGDLTIYVIGEDLSGLEGITEAGGNLAIRGINLNTLEGLNNLQSVTSVSITGTNITTLAPLASIQSNLQFIQFTDLRGVSDLSPLTNSTGDLVSLILHNCEELNDISVLSDKIGANMKLISLIQLSIPNLDVFNNVISLENRLTLKELPQITHLDDLSNLTGISGSLSIEGNSQLNDFCGLQTLFTSQGVSGNVRIWQNGYDPSVSDIAAGDCSF